MTDWTPVLTGLAFAEGPRWHDGALYLSDIFGCAVWRVPLAGEPEVVLEVKGRPSGLGWLPDGRMLVVSMRDRKLLAFDGATVTEHADLNPLTGGDCNDMVVDTTGRAYVGNFGYDFIAGEPIRPTRVVLVEPSGAARAVGDEVTSPNGMVVTSDGRTLIVAETRAGRMSAFTIDDDGGLSDHRVHVTFDNSEPDGICLDAEGAVWVASPPTAELLRVLADGTVAERMEAPHGRVQACALGGADGRTLFVCSTSIYDEAEALATRVGRVDSTQVSVPAAEFGSP
jgi:sugar lactone lactonase YvrE